MCDLKEVCRSSSENSMQSVYLGVRCRCMLLKAVLSFLCMSLQHACVVTYIVQAFWTCILVCGSTKSPLFEKLSQPQGGCMAYAASTSPSKLGL